MEKAKKCDICLCCNAKSFFRGYQVCKSCFYQLNKGYLKLPELPKNEARTKILKN